MAFRQLSSSKHKQSVDTEARRKSVLARLLYAAQYDDNEIPTLKNYQYVEKVENNTYSNSAFYFVINLNLKIADPLMNVFQKICS